MKEARGKNCEFLVLKEGGGLIMVAVAVVVVAGCSSRRAEVSPHGDVPLEVKILSHYVVEGYLPAVYYPSP